MLADRLHKPRGPSLQRGRSADSPGPASWQVICRATGFPIDSCLSFSSNRFQLQQQNRARRSSALRCPAFACLSSSAARLKRTGIHSSLLGGSLFTPAAAHLCALGNALLPAPPDSFISPPTPARHARGQQVCKMHADALLHQRLLFGPRCDACCVSVLQGKRFLRH